MPDSIDACGPASLQRQPPALLAVLVQVLAWGAVLLLHALSETFMPELSMPWPVLAQGAAAWGIATCLRQPRWWRFIHLLFFPAAWLVMQAELDPAWFLAALILLLLTSLGTLRTRVPLYLSSPQAASQVARLLPDVPGQRLLDLGCGLGGPLSRLAALRPDLDLHGVEAAPLNWLVSWLRLRGQARVRLGSLWDEDLSAYDAVYAYLSPAPMRRLWDKAVTEMRPGSLFISNTFAVPGIEPEGIVELNDLSRARLLIWRMP